MHISIRSNNPRLWLIALIPMLLVACCAVAFVAPVVPAAFGNAALVLTGSQATGTITAIQPCATGLTLAASAGGGFSYSAGASGDGVSVTVSYNDAHGQAHTGQTAVCTTLPANSSVGQALDVIYRGDAPATILLAKDRGAYQGVLITVSIALVIFFGLLFLIVRAWRARPAPAFNPAANPMVNNPRADTGYGLPPATSAAYSETQSRIRSFAEQAIGPGNYPTRQIRLKEALMLLHLRHPTTTPDDEPTRAGRHIPLRDHLVMAALLMDLVLQRRIDVQREGTLIPRWYITMIDATPTGDQDTDTFLNYVQASGQRVTLNGFYQRNNQGNLAARLIDQLRQGGYVRVDEPLTGRFAQEREQPANVLARGLMNVFGSLGFRTGAVVATDDYRKALPWQFLDTTHTPAEEEMLSRAQSSIAAQTTTDNFTQALLLLVAAHHLEFNVFPRRYRAAKSLYRLYPADQRKAIAQTLRKMAEVAPDGLRAIYRRAKRTDEQIENPPD